MGRAIEKGQKSYTPSKTLKAYFDQKFHLIELESRTSSAAGNPATEVDDLRRKVKTAKNHTMETLFQSLANLVYFFESVAVSPIMQEEFEKEIQHLLGIGQHLYNVGGHPKYSMVNVPFQLGNMVLKERPGNFDPSSFTHLQDLSSNFGRLLSAILVLRDTNEQDFRFVLASMMQVLVSFKLLGLYSKEYETRPRILEAAKNDLAHAKEWAEYAARDARSDLVRANSSRVLYRAKIWGGYTLRKQRVPKKS
jgi:hypothetical protein